MKILFAVVFLGVVAAVTYGRQHKTKVRKQQPVASVPAYQTKVPIAAQTQYHSSQSSYQEPGKGHRPLPQVNYGPDTSNFQYQVPIYDPKTYGNAAVNVNRFPGGATYNVNENSQGSDVKVNVQTSSAGGHSSKLQY